MPITFNYRKIDLEFNAGVTALTAPEKFTGTSFSTTNLRTVARVVGQMAPQGISADILVWGLTLDHINELTTYQGAGDQCGTSKVKSNRVTVYAGDDDNGMRPIFDGDIIGAWPEMMNQPLGPFHINALGVPEAAVSKEDPTSHDGEKSNIELAQKLIGSMGASPDLGGMTQAMINSPYLRGSKLHQLTQLLAHTGDSWVYQNGKITVVSKGANKPHDGWFIAPPYVGRDILGLVGYPAFTDGGILLKVEYSHPIELQDQIMVQSSINLANGPWTVQKVDYDLESQQPGGHWFVTLEGTRPC